MTTRADYDHIDPDILETIWTDETRDKIREAVLSNEKHHLSPHDYNTTIYLDSEGNVSEETHVGNAPMLPYAISLNTWVGNECYEPDDYKAWDKLTDEERDTELEEIAY